MNKSTIAEIRKITLNKAKEDSPGSLNFQYELMKKTGFSHVEILHKNLCFTVYAGIK